MEISVPKSPLPLRRARASRFQMLYPTRLYPARRRQTPSWRLVGAIALPVVAIAAAGFLARRRFFQGVAVFAKAVEEVADAVEDAAEDLGEAAEKRAEESK